jgi:hypothetical protein
MPGRSEMRREIMGYSHGDIISGNRQYWRDRQAIDRQYARKESAPVVPAAAPTAESLLKLLESLRAFRAKEVKQDAEFAANWPNYENTYSHRSFVREDAARAAEIEDVERRLAELGSNQKSDTGSN